MTVDGKRKAQAKRNEQRKLNQEKYELNKRNRERRQKNQEQEKLRKRTDSSSHPANIIKSSKQLENKDGTERMVEQTEAMEAFGFPDENISDSDIYGDQSGFGDNFQESSGVSPDIAIVNI